MVTLVRNTAVRSLDAIAFSGDCNYISRFNINGIIAFDCVVHSSNFNNHIFNRKVILALDTIIIITGYN